MFWKKPISAHCFDNYSVEKWITGLRKFDNKKRKVIFHLTGGEVFLDIANFRKIIGFLASADFVDNVKIDTNASIDIVKHYGDLDLSKFYLMISYHPENTTLPELFNKIKDIQENTNVRMIIVNYVMAPEQRDDYEAVFKQFARIGVFVNCGIYYNEENSKPDYIIPQEEFDLYNKYLPVEDIECRFHSTAKIKGEACYFPNICLNILPDGTVYSSCFRHRQSNLIENLTNEILNILPDTVCACPTKICRCWDMYGFLKRNLFYKDTIRPIEKYVNRCKEHSALRENKT
jgi:hypothetical protein